MDLILTAMILAPCLLAIWVAYRYGVDSTRKAYRVKLWNEQLKTMALRDQLERQTWR